MEMFHMYIEMRLEKQNRFENKVKVFNKRNPRNLSKLLLLLLSVERKLNNLHTSGSGKYLRKKTPGKIYSQRNEFESKASCKQAHVEWFYLIMAARQPFASWFGSVFCCCFADKYVYISIVTFINWILSHFHSRPLLDYIFYGLISIITLHTSFAQKPNSNLNCTKENHIF